MRKVKGDDLVLRNLRSVELRVKQAAREAVEGEINIVLLPMRSTRRDVRKERGVTRPAEG